MSHKNTHYVQEAIEMVALVRLLNSVPPTLAKLTTSNDLSNNRILRQKLVYTHVCKLESDHHSK